MMIKITKFKAVMALSLTLILTSCASLSGQAEVGLALNKWYGKNINGFFFKYGKGEFQAQYQGQKAYIWKSLVRNVEVGREIFTIKVENKYVPGSYIFKDIVQPGTIYNMQCILRIETTSNNKITSIEIVKNTNECLRYFHLSDAEREAIIESQKNS